MDDHVIDRFLNALEHKKRLCEKLKSSVDAFMGQTHLASEAEALRTKLREQSHKIEQLDSGLHTRTWKSRSTEYDRRYSKEFYPGYAQITNDLYQRRRLLSTDAKKQCESETAPKALTQAVLLVVVGDSLGCACIFEALNPAQVVGCISAFTLAALAAFNHKPLLKKAQIIAERNHLTTEDVKNCFPVYYAKTIAKNLCARAKDFFVVPSELSLCGMDLKQTARLNRRFSRHP